ncbi:MAG: N-6 DNA methylase [Candidatus Eisenbacteria sp.]|nr:N-6 DNA methylase [Candidatus Eisenbacteria bacterium]
MTALASELRSKLERAIIEAREAAEEGARTALESLAVHHHEPYTHMDSNARHLRNHLRARARQLGDAQDRSGRLQLLRLVQECAYEHWHRMLFARFLAENALLIEPESQMPISLDEAEELGKASGVDRWGYASRCAERMLPQIFRPDDPLLRVGLAREHQLKLERLLNGLHPATFTAADALGWVYQYWQSKRKAEVNASGEKIGADELPAVTQLFTEPYMVSFLIHNTLGAWWAGRKLSKDPSLATSAESEEQLRRALSLPGVTWDYLRFVRGDDGDRPWQPAAGIFPGWPRAAADLRVLDPCCGSGHFLVSLIRHLVPIRMAEEGFTARDAVDAVLRENLSGLEIDERCTQIAAFAIALCAWTYPDAGGHRKLPEIRIACSGIAPQASQADWCALAGDDLRTQKGIERLHKLFQEAPTLGSLIDPARATHDDLLEAGFDELRSVLEEAAQASPGGRDYDRHELAVSTRGVADAVGLLGSIYHLVITNVPYLARGKQAPILKEFIELRHNKAKHDLATAFVARARAFCASGGTAALVTPQNWLFLGSYKKLRQELLVEVQWDVVARLGENGFQSSQAAGAFTALLSLTRSRPAAEHRFAGLDASEPRDPKVKAAMLRGEGGEVRWAPPEEGAVSDGGGGSPGVSRVAASSDVPWGAVRMVGQAGQLENPDSRIIGQGTEAGPWLSECARYGKGSTTGDAPRFLRHFWTVARISTDAVLWLNSPQSGDPWSGRERFCVCPLDHPDLVSQFGCWLRGQDVWERLGVAVNKMRDLEPFLYLGEVFDDNVCPICPDDPSIIPALWAYVSSSGFHRGVRLIDQKLNVTAATITKVPFDLEHWQKVADEKYPHGLPEPYSDDPTQWLFHGRPEVSTAPLQVAVGRLLGYRWPAETDKEMRLSTEARELIGRCGELERYSDRDGIVCIASVRGEDPAAERLRALLATAYGTDWSPDREAALISESGSPAKDLDDWLRSDFFQQHCKLLHHRPFIWHIWDGRKRDGFHALVNYHRLAEGKAQARMLLENLTYSYLGDWITCQKDGVKRGAGGAEERLTAAMELKQRLEAILAGEPPFDIFVRWKPLAEQPIGWEPDINDGVRLNIRPFLASDLPNGRRGAGILRWKPNIKWGKDRGKEPSREREEHPWFWGWDERTTDWMGGSRFDGNRYNACHYTIAVKRKARAKNDTEKEVSR